ncbi:transposable element Tcb1 transposase [Trichonephila clavipes]|nr:transposable element Tcb1 transposase [Trichonephila clavipes]
MTEAGWSARRVARQLGRSDCVGAPVSSRTIRNRLAEGHLRSRRPLRVLPLTPTHRRLRLQWCRARGETGLQRNGTRSSLATREREFRFNLSSDDNRVREWRLRGEHLNPAFALQRYTASTAGEMLWGCNCLQYTVIPSIDPWHHDSPAVYPYPATTCVATHATASMSHFSTRQCLASHGKGDTRLSPHCY